MKAVIATLAIFWASSLPADPGKGPDWWCRAVDGKKSNLGFGKTEAEAAADAMTQCGPSCEVKECGEW